MTRILAQIAVLMLASTALVPMSDAAEPHKSVTFRSDGVSHTAHLFLSSSGSHGFVAMGTPPQPVTDIMPMWDLQVADLDADGDDELLVGTWSSRGPQIAPTQRTIWVMRWNGTRLVDVWRGSRLPVGFERFTTQLSKSGADLVTYESGPGLPPTRYAWTGFGFARTGRNAALRLVFVGDTAIKRGKPRTLMQPPTEALAAILRADIAIANLEASVGPLPTTTMRPEPHLVLEPRDLEQLSRWSIDAVTRANNHALDAGRAGFEQTSIALRSQAIRDATHTNLAPGLLLVSATRHPPRSAAPFPVLASAASIASFVEHIRKQARKNTVIVSLHGGPEGRVAPTESDRRLTRQLIAAGADAVVWHGAHRAAPVEHLDGSIVAWNLGDFALKRHNDGCALHLEFGPSRALRVTNGPWSCKH